MKNAKESLNRLIAFSAQRRADSQELARLVCNGQGQSQRARTLAARIYVSSADPQAQRRGRGRKRKGVA